MHGARDWAGGAVDSQKRYSARRQSEGPRRPAEIAACNLAALAEAERNREKVQKLSNESRNMDSKKAATGGASWLEY